MCGAGSEPEKNGKRRQRGRVTAEEQAGRSLEEKQKEEQKGNGYRMNAEEQEFRSLLVEAKQKAFENQGHIPDEEIAHIFSKLKLNGEQLALIRNYLDKALDRAGISGENSEYEAASECTPDPGGTSAPENVSASENASFPEPDDFANASGGEHLSLYLEELKRAGHLSDNQTRMLLRRAMQGDEEASAGLVEAFLPRVPEIAKLYAGQGVADEDLIGEGNIALLQAVKMLEVSETEKEAEGFVARMIMNAMEEAVEDQTDAGRLSGKLLERVNGLSEKARELSGELMRKVTVGELARETDFSEDEIRKVLRASGAHIEEIEEEQEDIDE